MSGIESHHEIALASIRCFTDDGTLDAGELNFLLGLALRDNIIDDDEKRVLSDIFSKVSKADVTPQVWERIEKSKRLFDIP